MAGDEFGRVLEHMDEPVQFAQDVIGQVAAGFGFTVNVNRHLFVFPAHFFDEIAQVQHRRVQIGTGGEFLVVDRQNKGAGAALLLGELRQVAIAGDAQNLESLILDRLGHGANARPRRILRSEIFVNDNNRKAEFHGNLHQGPRAFDTT